MNLREMEDEIRRQRKLILSMQWLLVSLCLAVAVLFVFFMWQSIMIIDPIIDVLRYHENNIMMIVEALNQGFTCTVV